ncbi:MAG: hypothetical protein ABW328_02320 [Ilumatobacteraceae bacterium]
MTILADRPLTVVVRRSGGFAGVARRAQQSVAPGTALHDAALHVLRSQRRRSAEPPHRGADGLTYDVAIASSRRTVLHRTFRDPLPDDVAALLAALASTGR